MERRSVAQSLSRGFALAGAVPLIVFSVLSVAYELPNFFDPCFSFAGGTVPITGPCRLHSGGTSQTIAETVLRLTLVQGSLTLAALLALKSTYLDRPKLMLVSFVIVFILTMPLSMGRFGIITLICSGCFLLAFVFRSK